MTTAIVERNRPDVSTEAAADILRHCEHLMHCRILRLAVGLTSEFGVRVDRAVRSELLAVAYTHAQQGWADQAADLPDDDQKWGRLASTVTLGSLPPSFVPAARLVRGCVEEVDGFAVDAASDLVRLCGWQPDQDGWLRILRLPADLWRVEEALPGRSRDAAFHATATSLIGGSRLRDVA